MDFASLVDGVRRQGRRVPLAPERGEGDRLLRLGLLLGRVLLWEAGLVDLQRDLVSLGLLGCLLCVDLGRAADGDDSPVRQLDAFTPVAPLVIDQLLGDASSRPVVNLRR